MLPESLAKRYNAIPVRLLDDGSVLVAVADPTNVMFSDELRLAIGAPLRVCVAAGDAIGSVIERTYDQDVGEVETVRAGCRRGATDLDLTHDTPAVGFVNKSIAKGLDIGASDIHFTPQAKRLVVRARVDGVMREIGSISSQTAPAVSSRLKIMGGLDIAERRAPQDGRVTIRRGDRPSTSASPSCPPSTARRSRSACSARARRRPRSTRSRCGRVASSARDGDPPAFRLGRRRRPHRLGQDDHALRLPAGAERAGPSPSSRSRIRSSTAPPASTRSRSTPAPASPSRAACGRSCAPTPTSSSSARSATRRRPRSPSAPR